MISDRSHRTLKLSALVILLMGGYLAYANFVMGVPLTSPFVSAIFAKDGEDDDDDKDEDKEKEDEEKEKEKEKKKVEKEKEKKLKEQQKAEERKKKEAADALKRSEKAKETSSDDEYDDDVVNGVKLRGDGTVDDDGKEEDEVDDDRSNSGKDEEKAMYKDRLKTLERLEKKLAQAEEKILEKQAEGVDVTAALAQLAEAKALVASVESAFTANELEKIEALVKKVERLAHMARGKTLQASEKVEKDVQKVAKRITQTEEKIATFTSFGGDATSYETRLAALKTQFADVQARIAAGGEGLLMALRDLESVERQVKNLKNAVESALYALGVGDDDEFESEYSDDSKEAVEDLRELASVESDDDSSALVQLAEIHESESAKTSDLVRQIESRNVFLKSLLGANQSTLTDLRAQAMVNSGRVALMQKAATNVSDPDLKAEIDAAIAALESENARLQSYLSAQEKESGILGWLFKRF